VFFLTAAQLLPQDTDTAFDIYDARICTQESPCLSTALQAPAPCGTTEGCRPASPSQQAPAGPSGTAAFTGPGNIAPPVGKQEVKGIRTSTKPLTQAQKLANALQACKKQHPHSTKRRHACEAYARKLYGPKTKAKKSTNAGRSSRGHATRRSGR
jgi:hypothetical protein